MITNKLWPERKGDHRSWVAQEIIFRRDCRHGLALKLIQIDQCCYSRHFSKNEMYFFSSQGFFFFVMLVGMDYEFQSIFRLPNKISYMFLYHKIYIMAICYLSYFGLLIFILLKELI